MSDDGSTKIFARQYESKKGTKYYWGKFGGIEVRIFKGKEHEGTPSLDVHVKPVAEEEPAATSTQTGQGDDEIPF